VFPPVPTKNPQTLTQNMWGSLKRAADDHWGDNATINPDGVRFKITLQVTQKINQPVWGITTKYIKRYARASNWKVYKLSHKKGYIEFYAEYSPPKTNKKNLKTYPGRRGNEEQKHQDQPA